VSGKLAESSLTLRLRESSKKSLKHYYQAAKLFGAADAMRELVASKIDLVDLAEYERQVGVLRTVAT
jgi:hypothetical protein